MSVRARNVPAVPDTVDSAATYFAVWSHQSTERVSDVQVLPGAYLSEQVRSAQTALCYLLEWHSQLAPSSTRIHYSASGYRRLLEHRIQPGVQRTYWLYLQPGPAATAVA